MMRVRKPTEEEIKETTDWGTWEKEASKFPWHYDQKEICYILDGEAIVYDKSGNRIKFGKGDWVEFDKGLYCTWEIIRPIKKKYLFK